MASPHYTFSQCIVARRRLAVRVHGELMAVVARHAGRSLEYDDEGDPSDTYRNLKAVAEEVAEGIEPWTMEDARCERAALVAAGLAIPAPESLADRARIDGRALNAMQDILSGTEWDSSTIEEIAAALARTGRTIAEPE